VQNALTVAPSSHVTWIHLHTFSQSMVLPRRLKQCRLGVSRNVAMLPRQPAVKCWLSITCLTLCVASSAQRVADVVGDSEHNRRQDSRYGRFAESLALPTNA
jgi:hypothetical protein